jgi:hypothetical protein
MSGLIVAQMMPSSLPGEIPAASQARRPASAGFLDVSLNYLSYLNWQMDPADPVESVAPCG